MSARGRSERQRWSTPLPPEFRAHQLRIAGLLDRARPPLASSEPSAWPQLASFRADLVAALSAYQTYKHAHIFDPAIEDGGERAALARQLKVDCVAMGLNYDAFRLAWPAQRDPDEWPAYIAAAHVLMGEIQAGLAREAALVPRLAELAGSPLA